MRFFFSALLGSLALGMLLATGWAAPTAAAAAAASASKLSLNSLPPAVAEALQLVIPGRCLPNFLALDFFSDSTCLKAVIAKLLGYAIIAGSCVVKLPQILKFLKAGSTEGVDRNGCYFELLGCMLQTIYHVRKGTPFSAYGETAIITVQTAVIVLMVWGYNYPGLLHAAAVAGGLAAVAGAAYTAQPELLSYFFLAASGLFILSRLLQVIANFRQGNTGQLAPLTLIMNCAGTAARVFTSATEVKQLEVFLSAVAVAVLNAVILGQFLVFGGAKPTAKSASTQTATASSKGSKKQN